MSEPKVLCFYLGDRDHYRPVMFSPTEVFVSPDCADGADGRGIRTLRPAAAQYDVADILRRLPAEQHPDLVVVKIDASRRNMPRNLGVLRCPKVLVLGDTHHLTQPIARLLDYAAAEPFDLILSDHDRHHLHYFRKAGFARVAWIPCLTWRPFWHDPQPEGPADRAVVFVGQIGNFHPWRRHVLEAARHAGLPLWFGRLPQDEAAKAYAEARGAINCSLNGDFNLRAFEILGAGGLLLADRLAPQSGMSRLLVDGLHCATWAGPDELIEKARHYLAHPDEAMAIRRAGRRLVEAEHSPEVQQRRFFELLFDNKVHPPFALDDEPRCRVAQPLSAAALRERVAIYERLQDVHKAAARLRMFARPGARVVEDLSDLPRVSSHDHAELAGLAGEGASLFEAQTAVAGIEHVLVIDPAGLSALDDLMAVFRGRWVVLDGGQDVVSMAAFGRLAADLAGWGFAELEARGAVFVRRDALAGARRLAETGRAAHARSLLESLLPVLGEVAPLQTAAAVAASIGAMELVESCLGGVVRLDRNQRRTLIALGRLRVQRGDPGAGFLMLNEARRLQAPLDDEDEALWAELNAAARAGSGLFDDYLAAVEPERRKPRLARRRILLVTNLFPPEEMGGYGRKLWEFSDSLARRGHDLRVLTGSADYLRRPQEPAEDRLEPIVSRTLKLYGGWSDGGTGMLVPEDEARQMVRHNTQTIFDMVQAFRPELVIIGNVDYLGIDYIQPILDVGIPVIHSLGTQKPAFSPELAPRHPLYCSAPASRWVGEEMIAQGHAMERWTVLYPGARTQHFYRLFLPEVERLRILYAGLVLPYKGPHVLINALMLLHTNGIDFSCTLAGDTTDPAFTERMMQACRDCGFGHKVSFAGFQDRAGLSRLFNSHNVFVFPSIVLEAFGIVQVEAMAAGLACVTTATGGGREIVRDGVDGLLFERGDATALANHLSGLLSNPARWRGLQHAGRQRALSFSVEHSVDTLERAMEELLADAAHRRTA
ncbi:MAG: glycosyltransferase [Alphaproteobacteria bacterium]|nr:glycosyltransferase [Alphaproteobacteria bacterium]